MKYFHFNVMGPGLRYIQLESIYCIELKHIRCISNIRINALTGVNPYEILGTF